MPWCIVGGDFVVKDALSQLGFVDVNQSAWPFCLCRLLLVNLKPVVAWMLKSMSYTEDINVEAIWSVIVCMYIWRGLKWKTTDRGYDGLMSSISMKVISVSMLDHNLVLEVVMCEQNIEQTIVMPV